MRIQRKNQASIVVDEIICEMRNACPPIKLLCQNKRTGLWEEAGVNVIRAKVTQAFQYFHIAKLKEAKEMGHFQTNEVHHKADVASYTSETCK